MPNDILLDENNDLLIEDGDFVIGESTLQHQQLLLYCNKNDIKEFPTRCVGLSRFLETSDEENLAREIDVDFNKDGMRVDKISVDIPIIDVEASYD